MFTLEQLNYNILSIKARVNNSGEIKPFVCIDKRNLKFRDCKYLQKIWGMGKIENVGPQDITS